MGFLPRSPREPLRHTIAFRLTTTEYLEILPFFEAFESGSEALRWLLTHPETRALMGVAVAAGDVPRALSTPIPIG